MNREGIRQLKFDMRSNSESYRQNTYGDTWSCGTVQCMAGFCLIRKIGYQAFLDLVTKDRISALECENAGIDQLGLNTSSDKNPIIFCNTEFWPYDLSHRYYMAKDQAERVEIACEALDRLQENGDIMNLEEYQKHEEEKWISEKHLENALIG